MLQLVVLTFSLSVIWPDNAAIAADDASVVVDSRPALKVGLGFGKPPYVIADEMSGFWPDVMTEALDRMGYRLEPAFISLARMNRALTSGSLDIITGLPNLAVSATCHSPPFVGYQNVAFHRKSDNHGIESIDELANHNVIAFQKASDILGDEFSAMAKNNPRYQEVVSQINQARSFAAGRNDVAVMDRNIFYWIYDNILNDQSKRTAREDISESHIFTWQENHGASFSDPALCNKFTSVINEMRADGTLGKIKDKYGILKSR